MGDVGQRGGRWPQVAGVAMSEEPFMAVGMTVQRSYMLVDAEVYEFLRTQYLELVRVREEKSSGSCIYSAQQGSVEQFQIAVRAVKRDETLLVARTSKPVKDDAEFGNIILRHFRAWQKSDEAKIALYRTHDPDKSPQKPPKGAPIEAWLAYREAVRMATGRRPSYRAMAEMSEYSENQFKKYVQRSRNPDEEEPN